MLPANSSSAGSVLPVSCQEFSQLVCCFLKLSYIRQVHYSEMIRRSPVEALSGNQKDLFLMKEIKSKLLIIVNVEFLCIDLREDIESCLWLHSCNSRSKDAWRKAY